jgi:hypothetical protein
MKARVGKTGKAGSGLRLTSERATASVAKATSKMKKPTSRSTTKSVRGSGKGIKWTTSKTTSERVPKGRNTIATYKGSEGPKKSSPRKKK